MSTKTKINFYRRIYVAYLIDTGVDSVSAIVLKTGMHRRTVQDCINLLSDFDIIVVRDSNNIGHYVVTDWSAIKKSWVASNLSRIRETLHCS